MGVLRVAARIGRVPRHWLLSSGCPAPMRHRLCSILAVAASVVTAACSLDFLEAGKGLGFELVSIDVEPPDGEPPIVEVGDTLLLSARGRGTGLLALFSYDRLLDATWRASPSDLASVAELPQPRGEDSTTPTRARFHGVAPGIASAQVSARRVTGILDVRVIPGVARIDLAPLVQPVRVGDTVDVIGVASDSDGRPIPQLPLRFQADSGLVDAGRVANGIRVTAADTGSFGLTARFRRVTGSIVLRVTRRGPNESASAARSAGAASRR
jgi:hypothetical protein